ncbi:hypothetical protein M422DRAFT_254226 [Sphaerobolus stellatus SS14]|uniref:Uncharacterized protein n=1 Tax=Sphaerobolus stellatus (strain SS14) TaxID=990650 RepID=A0A0C9VVP2_SPHS4|nr:hypothetical protein M422DRAFT_254226 [Sphaerobolus stellatus SS14]
MATKQTIQLGMRAVAILMVEVARKEETMELARKIVEQMAIPTDQMQNTVTEARALTKEIQKATQDIKEMQEKTLKNLTEALQVIGKPTTYASVTAVGQPTGTPIARAA